MGYKTGKRELILEFLSRGDDASYTAEEIADAIIPSGSGMSTVYRLISELVKSGCVRRLSDGKTRRVTYQYVGDEHCHGHMHLKCKGCGRLIHLDEQVSRAFEEKILSIGGFAIEEGSFLFGRCRECTEVTG
jgi:Fur family ferric uptake transcriptional regulator